MQIAASVRRARRVLLSTTVITVLAAAALSAQRSGTQLAQPAGPVRSAVPAELGPAQYFSGTPWVGQPPVTVTVAELMAREAIARLIEGPPLERRRQRAPETEFNSQRENPDAPAVSQWPPSGDARVPGSASAHIAFNITTSWRGPKVSESGFIPPDSNGAVGPTQVLVTANGRFKVYDKSGTLGGFNVSDATFWSSVVTPGADNFVSDPHVRYDRLSGRWFITEIDVPEPCECSNRILIAVSSGSTITDSTSFTLYQFQHDIVGPTPNPDTGGFADYDTLGVDANALYIGVNEFGPASAPSFLNTTGYVVRKSSLTSGGPIVVTAFRQMLDPATFSGPYTPQGVDNDDQAAAEGYFIGVDGQFFSRLAMRRVITPGGTPSISGTMIMTVPTTRSPIPQVAQGSIKPLDAIDTRLFAAMVKKNKLTGVSSLWTAHNIGVLSTGIASASADRNAGRWYQIDNLTTTTPTLTQSGTVFDPAASNQNGFWINSIAANGQGHAAIGQSWAGSTVPPSVAVLSRLSSDPAGQMNDFQQIAGVAGYNIQTNGTQRWGDFSQVVVDPTDDMTLWTFQEYADAVDSWAVRAVKLQAPPPATPSSASPPSISQGVASTVVTITGTSSLGSGFFEPGSGFSNHIQASVNGGVIVNSATFLTPTTVALDVSSVSATVGPKDVTVTNPDGQSMTGTGVFSVAAVSCTFALTPTSASFGAGASSGNTVAVTASASSCAWTATPDGSAPWLTITGGASGTGDGTVTYDVSQNFGAFRTANPTIAGMTFPVSQASGCEFMRSPPTASVGAGASSGNLVSVLASASNCPWTASDDPSAPWLTITSGTSGTGNGTVTYSVTANPGGARDANPMIAGQPYLVMQASGCTFALSPTSAAFGAAGGSGSSMVTTASTCSWTATTPASWITFGTSSGVGTGTMTFTAMPNATGAPRTATITVADQMFLVTESARGALGDFDGDGKSDVTVFRPSTGGWYSLKSSTNNTSSQSFFWGLSTDVPMPGDYDGDGKTDPAIFRPSTGLWAVLKSSTNYTTSLTVSWGLSTDTPVPGDFDGDGKTDPAVYRPSTGGWYILKSSTNYTSSLAFAWGLSTDLPMPGDYDGDGSADPAIFRPSTGLWAILKSSTSYTTSMTVSWGLSTDVAVPGDYDGDGKIDPAIYRPSTGLWAILKSGSGYGSAIYVSWGLSTDVPVPADYDGDGRFDPAIFRPSTGLWAILKSSTGFTTSMMASWGLSTDTPINKRP